MSKKDFKGGLDSLLGGEPNTAPNQQQVKRLVRVNKELENIIREIRATFIVDADLNDKLKAIAYFERVNIKDCLNEALKEYISKYEKKNGLDYLSLYKKNNNS